MPFLTDEHYHLYNRGAHKAPIFHDKQDYERFLHMLYLMNSSKKIIYKRAAATQIFSCDRGGTSITIISYCLMPNHFHILVKEKISGGINRFLRKICTAYAMYYNKKYNHSGTIFQGSCKSRHVDNDEYFRYLIQYIHLNPFGIEEPEMNKMTKSEYYTQAVAYSKTYEFSSYRDYLGEHRPQKSILEIMP